MSILIKGMEMPESCNVCPVCDYEQGNCLLLNERSTLYGFDRRHNRAPWCPLVNVKPHGRLIDADALTDVFRKIIADCQKWAKNNIPPDEHIKSNRIKRAEEDFVEAVLHVKDAPTIIEAEGE